MNCTSIFVGFVGILFASGLYANPTDDVCDELVDASPGLYGMCVAFCIAHPPGDSGTLELSKSQLKILEAYNKKKTSEDPDMPCFNGCPCFTVKEAEFVATHSKFQECVDFVDEEVGVTSYERYQFIYLAGDLNESGYPQTRGSVGTSMPVPEPESPPWLLHCSWNYHEEMPYLDLDRWWEGDYFNETDQRKIEDCQAIIDHVADKHELPCETAPECTVRVVIDSVIKDDMSVDVNGFLINDPPEYCVNRNHIASVDWYWGDGAVDTYEMMPDGYVYPFPSSHTYSQNLGYGISIIAYDANGEIIDSAGRIVIFW